MRGVSTSETTLLSKAIDKRLMACAAAAAAAVGVANQAEAAVVYSGTQNIAIPATVAGSYFNLITGTGGTTSAFAGWDINPYRGTAQGGSTRMYLKQTAGQLSRVVVNLAADNGALPLAFGDTIDGTRTLSGVNSFLITTTGAAGSAQAGGTVFFGVQFWNETTLAQNFGWVRMNLITPVPAVNSTLMTLVDWAYDNTGAGITAGAGVPEPGSLGLLAAGAVGLLSWRRRSTKAA
ncbi:hypothetical protein BH09PLA1_BH09PLA1_23580 [soil metagenome]